jgi:hypothetical protein
VFGVVFNAGAWSVSGQLDRSILVNCQTAFELFSHFYGDAIDHHDIVMTVVIVGYRPIVFHF